MGNAYQELGNYSEAKNCYIKALSIDLDLKNPLDVATDYVNLAQFYMDIGETFQALANANEAKKRFRQYGHRQGLLEVTVIIALIYRLLGDIEHELKHNQIALQLAQELGHRHQEATIWNSFSLMHQRRGSWPEAVACQVKALSLYNEIGDQDGKATSLLNLGLIVNQLGDPDKGLYLLDYRTL